MVWVGNDGTTHWWFHCHLAGQFQKVVLGRLLPHTMEFVLWVSHRAQSYPSCSILNLIQRECHQYSVSSSSSQELDKVVLNRCLGSVWMRAPKIKVHTDKMASKQPEEVWLNVLLMEVHPFIKNIWLYVLETITTTASSFGCSKIGSYWYYTYAQVVLLALSAFANHRLLCCF